MPEIINRINTALAKFQAQNCRRCRYAEQKLVATGLPCCTHTDTMRSTMLGSWPIRCETRRDRIK